MESQALLDNEEKEEKGINVEDKPVSTETYECPGENLNSAENNLQKGKNKTDNCKAAEEQPEDLSTHHRVIKDRDNLNCSLEKKEIIKNDCVTVSNDHTDNSEECDEPMKKKSKKHENHQIHDNEDVGKVEEKHVEVGLEKHNLEQGKIENSDNEPCIIISFKCQTTLDSYKNSFLNFFTKFKEFAIKEENLSLHIHKTNSFSDHLETDLESNTDKSSHSSRKRKKKSKDKKELFIVDTSPSKLKNIKLQYTSKFKIGEEKLNENIKKTQICFNCNGEHMLRDCPQPKDLDKIHTARQKHKTQSNNSKLRYHLEEDQKYAHLHPGKISENLRKALGIKKNELPPYVYLMRTLGYPPGWIEEAKEVNSELELFGIEGGSELNTKRKKGIDYKKIVEYPGFNVPMSEDIEDDYRSYGVPPYSEIYNKEKMIKFIEDQIRRSEDDLETLDMDLSLDEANENDKEIQQDELVEEKKDEAPETEMEITDLEEQKKQLLKELNETKEEPIKYVKSSTFGTPILKSSSPYSKLPKVENFSKDVSPAIDFENLPNSTGKYEQMSSVLQKVRTLKKNLSCPNF